jgi:hypothetical protein
MSTLTSHLVTRGPDVSPDDVPPDDVPPDDVPPDEVPPDEVARMAAEAFEGQTGAD